MSWPNGRPRCTACRRRCKSPRESVSLTRSSQSGSHGGGGPRQIRVSPDSQPGRLDPFQCSARARRVRRGAGSARRTSARWPDGRRPALGTPEPPLPHVPDRAVVTVVAPRVSRQQPLHPAAEVAVAARAEHDGEVVGHQAVAEQVHRQATARVGLGLDEGVVVGRLVKHRVAAAARFKARSPRRKPHVKNALFPIFPPHFFPLHSAPSPGVGELRTNEVSEGHRRGSLFVRVARRFAAVGRRLGPGGCKVENPATRGAGQKAGMVVTGVEGG